MSAVRTKQQIKNEIDIENKKKLNQEAELKKYNSALGYVNTLLDDVKKIKENLSSAEDNLRKNYSSSGKSLDVKNISNLRKDTTDMYNYLRDKVKSRINTNISYLNSEISKTKTKISTLQNEYNRATM